MHTPPDAGVALFSVLFMVIFFIIGIAVTVLITVLPFWFICKKAGFHPALSLLMMVPIANLILPFVLAFAEWPALKIQSYPQVQPTPATPTVGDPT